MSPTNSPALQLSVGTAIPARIVPLSLQRLVMEAAVNRDFAPIHHDMDAGRQAGAPGAFANYMFLQSLVEFTVREWTGPAAVIERIALKLRSFNAVGMQLQCSGVVSEVTPSDQGTKVRAAIRVLGDGNVTCTGECDFRLPLLTATTKD